MSTAALPSHALTLPSTSSGVTVTVDADGTYSIATKSPVWKFAGSLNAKLTDIAAGTGTDRIGAYTEATFHWTSGVPLTGSIRAYQKNPVVLFSYTTDQAGNPAIDFPSFTSIPHTPHHFSYQNSAFSHYSFSLENDASPWTCFDDDANTFILSPATDFFVSHMSGDGVSTITSGLNGLVADYPRGFTHSSLLVVDKGIRHTFQTWGQSLTDYYGKARPTNTADSLLKYLGYWTDNGAVYYYNYDPALGYTGTLTDLMSYYHKQQIPVRYLQLDSWWYPKTNVSAAGHPGGKTKNAKLPEQTWNCYGGCTLYEASKDLFPTGLSTFADTVNQPLITHGRWIDVNSPYRQTYNISGVAPIDVNYWNDRMKYLSENGVRTYEQDWEDEIYDHSPGLSHTLDQGAQFLDNMASAAASHGVTLQYCMSLPQYYLQGAKYPNLTTVRVSNDRFDRSKWDWAMYGSMLSGSLGEWPWTDVFMSTEKDNLLLATLTAGGVGFGDKKGEENKANLMKSARADGRLVKPDQPIVPSDDTFVADAKNTGAPMVAWTDTQHGRRTVYVFCERRSSPAVSFKPASMGIDGDCYVYNNATGTGQHIDAGGTYVDTIPTSGVNYYEIAPVDNQGIAFLGDYAKFVGNGKARISELSGLTGNALRATVLMSPADAPVTLHGYSQARPVVASSNGRVGRVHYEASTGRFIFDIQPGESAKPAIVDGDPAYSVDVSITGGRSSRDIVSASPASIDVVQGSTGTVTIDAPHGAALSASKLPTGVTATFDVNGKMTLTSSAAAAVGSYSIEVSAGGNSTFIPVTVEPGGSHIKISCGGPDAAPFVADTYYSGGTISNGTDHKIDTHAAAGPQSIWRHGRWGDFSYAIPGLVPGASYNIQLDFDEYTKSGPGQRKFDVSINGAKVLTDFDVYATAGGRYVAITKSFPARANTDGQVVIEFEGVVDNAMVQGIEVSPAAN